MPTRHGSSSTNAPTSARCSPTSTCRGTMCGVTLAGRVHDAWPDIRLVVTSGRQRFTNGEIPNHGRFVPKPYSLDQVVDAIRHAV